MTLNEQRCEVCRPGMKHLSDAESRQLMDELNAAWSLVGGHERIERTFKTPNFADAVALAVRVGFLAEVEGHHPDLHIGWGRLRVEIWTHHANGLTKNDFILAAKIDAMADS